MTRAILLFTAIAVAAANGGTIQTPNDTIQVPSGTNRNMSKREILEFYPDWVPFKNKHGNELGEFVDVNKPKAKVKKRLALPINFLMRAVSDDLEDLGQGDSDSDDEYYKKDVADDNRSEYKAVEPHVTSNTPDIVGLLKIITQKSPSLADDINKSISKLSDKNQDEPVNNPKIFENLVELSTTPEPEIDEGTSKSKTQSEEEYEEDSESTTTTTTTSSTTKKPELSEEEQKENERKKKIILDSVDDLKQRHEQEQRIISEKAKEEEFNNEFHHENRKVNKNRGRLSAKRQRGKITTPDYAEYEDSDSWKDKYNINVERKTTTDEPLPETTQKPRQKPKRVHTQSTPEEDINSELGKYSVFRNPSKYIVEYEDLNDKEYTTKPKTPRRFSSKYVATTPNSIESAEHHLYPTRTTTTEGEAEPILYFPKIKNKKKPRKSTSVTTTTLAPDSFVAETVEDKLKQTTVPVTYPVTARQTTDDKTTALDNYNPTSTDSVWSTETDVVLRNENNEADKVETEPTAQDTTANEDFTSPAADETGPSGEAATNNSETVTDAVPASSDHAKEEPKDYHVEKGGGHEHTTSHEEEHEEHGKKAYEGLHKDTKTKKGHHDKEDHLGKYEDRGGHNKEHHDESGHYGGHHHEEHGKKHAKYEESGKHSKGHSTKGSHDIHKKEEYEKKVEFFEEEGDSAEEEKHGGYHNEKEHKEGGNFKKGNLQNEHHEKKKGEAGHFVKGGHHDVNKGHKSSGGHDSHGRHGGAHHAAGGHQSGKKWVYHHGYPAKNANLIVIDRRTDQYMHGPTYFG